MSEPATPVPWIRRAKWQLRVAAYAGWLAGAVLVGVDIAVPPRHADDGGVLALMVAWVALLIVADAYMFIRQRRIARPDYVALAVALTALIYSSEESADWTRFTCLGLAVLSTVAGWSLWSQRGFWAVTRSQAAPTPDADAPAADAPAADAPAADAASLDVIAPGAVAPSVLSSSLFAPNLRNRRLFAPIAVFLVFASGIWWRADSVNHVPSQTEGRPQSSGAASSTHTVDALGHRNPLCVFGERVGLSNQTDQAPGNDVQVVVASVVAHPTGNGPTAPPPKDGEYEVATVTITGELGAFPYAPTFLIFMTNTGKTYTSADGNSATSGYGPALQSGAVTKGEHVTGTITFDVPPGGGRVQLPFGFSGSACDWLVGT